MATVEFGNPIAATRARCDAGHAIFRRARPLLGTLVEVRCEGVDSARAARACDAAFGEVAAIHRLMSFHEAGSDLDALHRACPGTPVRVDARTRDVLALAIRIASVSDGSFDPTVAAQQVAWGFLPRPASTWSPDPRADWRDIHLVGSDRVCLSRPLWIDLGGIAKGFAVDRAVEILLQAGAVQVCVNAGGDLRIAGERAELVFLHAHAGSDAGAVIELANAAVAGSSGSGSRRRIGSHLFGPHVHGKSRAPVSTQARVSVVAPTCIVADALTKVVLSGDDANSSRVLERFGAQGCIHDAGSKLLLLGVVA